MNDFTKYHITLSDRESLCLKNIKKAGSFRSDSHAIGETLIFVQAIRDNPKAIAVLGARFGIQTNCVEESKKEVKEK